MTKLIGYARVSTDDQTPALQLDALARAGCERVFTDQGVCGAAPLRPALQDALGAISEGDVLVVWRLDRLGRSLADLIALINGLKAKGCGFRSLSEAIDTTTAGGVLIFHVLGALAEFERGLIAERTRAGLAAAKQRGKKLGRRKALSPDQVAHARKLVDAGEPVTEVAKTLKVDRATLYRALAPSLPSSSSKK